MNINGREKKADADELEDASPQNRSGSTRPERGRGPFAGTAAEVWSWQMRPADVQHRTKDKE
jgi:hypothetical protein